MEFRNGYRIKATITALITILAMLPVYYSLQSYLRDSAPDFSQFAAGPERKQEFIRYFTPVIQCENAAVLKERELAQKLMPIRSNLGFLQKRKLRRLLTKYKLENFHPEDPSQWAELLKRIDKVPVSLALAQAAKESGWGSSRFAREGNNFFGQWCFEPGCGLIPKNRDRGKTHEVASFSSAADSVKAYIQNLNHNQAYTDLREMRLQQREASEAITGVALAGGLAKYSERGEVYVREIRNLIKHNKLESIDIPSRENIAELQ